MQIKIPDIGDVDSVEVIEICVAVGDEVGAHDTLIVIESDKASMEVPAGVAGTVTSIDCSLGDSVAAGDAIITVDAAAGSVDANEPAAASASENKREEQPAPTPEPVSEPVAVAAPELQQLDVLVPDIGEADNVTVVEIAVAVDAEVSVGDLLLVLESDKASMEIPSEHQGRVVRVHTAVGAEVAQGTLLLTLETAQVSAEPQPPSAPPDITPATNTDTSASVRAPAQKAVAANATEVTIYAGPAVRRLARELGVDLAQVPGSGTNSRIVKEDVKDFVKSQLSGTATQGLTQGSGIPALPSIDFTRFGETELQPLGRTREVGAQNLHRSWLNVVHVTQHDEVDVTDLEVFRKSLKSAGEAKGIKVTPLAFIIKACCAALQEFPTVNSSLDTEIKNYILKRYFHIGFAVDTPQGLLVPVIRDVDRKGIWELSAEIVELAGKARDRKLTPDALQGGTFSVSSLGALGGTGFTPIVNAPEVAILGVGRLSTRPLWQDTEFVPRKMLPLSFSYDHRAINGAEAGRFVQRLGQLLADVRQLIL